MLSTASGMQRHIRLAHLGCGGAAGWGGPGRLGVGQAKWASAPAPTCYVPSRRQAEPEQSDGEEDFYYTELDIGLEVLTNGLSSLTPMSPTASLLPTFPHLEPPALPSLLHPLALPPPQVLSPAAPAQVCHSDHSYQVGEVTHRQQLGLGPRGALDGSKTTALSPAGLPGTHPAAATAQHSQGLRASPAL